MRMVNPQTSILSPPVTHTTVGVPPPRYLIGSCLIPWLFATFITYFALHGVKGGIA